MMVLSALHWVIEELMLNIRRKLRMLEDFVDFEKESEIQQEDFKTSKDEE